MQRILTAALGFILTVTFSFAGEYYVDDLPANGTGTPSNPFNSVQEALENAQPGDVVYVMPGIYSESIQTVRSGSAGQPITIKAQDSADPPRFRRSGQLLEISDRYITVEGLVFDGQFAGSDLVRIGSGGDYAILRNCEIKNGTKDGIDLNEADHVLIENCRIHHLLGGSFSDQVDAHGIVATSQIDLTIRGCDIYYVSGDCFQSDPGRGEPRWDEVLIEDCRLWTGPLPADAAEWKAGEIPGENGVDTKVKGEENDDYRATLTIRNVEAFGFVPGYINNRAAFNLKEKVDCRLENIKVYQNEIAFRLRGPNGRGGARVTLINCVAYDNQKTFRTEENLEQLHIYNGTFDKTADSDYFQNVAGGFDPAGFELQNCLFVGELPEEAAHSSNLLANVSFFEDAGAGNYRLAPESPAIDAGIDIAEVSTDFDGVPRLSGQYDVGAFERDRASGAAPGFDPVPRTFFLHQNFPNPFNPTTTLTFDLQEALPVKLQIYDALGRVVRTLVADFLLPGRHAVQWDGRDHQNAPVPSGVYLYRLTAGKESKSHKMHLLR